MNGSLQKLQSLARLREGLLRRGKSGNASAVLLDETKKLKNWLEGNRGLEDKHAEGYVRRHADSIQLLIPGSGCKSEKSWRAWVDTILNEKA